MTPPWWIPLHTHHSPQDTAEWLAYSVATRTAADAVGAMILWSATGRQFDAEPTIARPVLCPQLISEADVTTAPFYPVDLGSGDWINLIGRCHCTSLEDFTRVTLRGPVNTVSSVTIDGVAVPPASWRLDEGEILARTDGNTWPLWQNTSLPSGAAGTFVIDYAIGIPAPAALLYAAGDYALEWARASAPNSSTLCRLPSRAKEITRQGISMTLVSSDRLLRDGLTGIPSIDGVVIALNPNRYVARPRVLVPHRAAPLVGF
jgi:hypothetical protein